jgi:MFS family permease
MANSIPAIQGVGGGGILNMNEIIVSDLVPLAERGLYQGILGLVWAFASAIGPSMVRCPRYHYRARLWIE